MDAFDFIVIGAGSAGCVLAERLSAGGRHRVLVLEAGGSDRSFWVQMPIGYGKLFYDARRNWRFTAQADAGLNGRASYWPRGKIVGGSSSINAMVYCRGLPGDFEDWRALGNPGWGWSDVRPCFEAIERNVLEDGRVAGSGPLWVFDVSGQTHPLCRHFFAAARELGLPAAEDFNGPSPEGVGLYRITTKGGRRWSAADAFLRPALRRPNLKLEIGISTALHVFFPGFITGKSRLAVSCKAGGCGSACSLAANGEALQQFSIEPHVQLLSPAHPFQIILILPL